MCRLQTPLAGLLAALLPRARIVPAVKGEDMSSDPEAIKTMEEDPLNSQGNVRARTANEMLKAFGHVAQQEKQLVLPIYAHHGEEDRLANLAVGSLLSIPDYRPTVGPCSCSQQDMTQSVIQSLDHSSGSTTLIVSVNVQAVRRMLENCSSQDTTLYVVPNGYHEVLMGTERTECTNRIADWILGHLARWSPPQADVGAEPTEAVVGQLDWGLQSSSSSSSGSSSAALELGSGHSQLQTGISGAELKQLGTMESGRTAAQKPLEPLSAAACQVSGSA